MVLIISILKSAIGIFGLERTRDTKIVQTLYPVPNAQCWNDISFSRSCDY